MGGVDRHSEAAQAHQAIKEQPPICDAADITAGHFGRRNDVDARAGIVDEEQIANCIKL